MNVLVDGVIYLYQTRGGISRIFTETLPRMCEIESELRVQLLISGKPRQMLPRHARLSHRFLPPVDPLLPPRRLWPVYRTLGAAFTALRIGKTANKIWHSTYFTRPIRWKGARVVTVADMIYELFPKLYSMAGDDEFRRQKKRCVQEADAVLCISQTTKKDLQAAYGLSPDKIRVVHLACGNAFQCLAESFQTHESRGPQPFLLYVGSRAHYKGFDTLLRSYSHWSPRKDVHLIVVGQDLSEEEKKCLTELRLTDRVHLLRNIDDEHLCHLYNRAAAFIYPSLYEGFGIPLLEAMACGCPIVASRIPSTLEVAGNIPIYFESGNVEALALALDHVLRDGRRSSRSIAGMKHVQQYSWNKAATETIELYKSLS